MQDLVLVYDEDDRNAQVYAGSEDMLYVSPEEFVTKRIVDVLPKRVSKNYVEKVKRVRATGNADTTDYWLEIGDETRWFSTILSRHEDGKSVVAVVRDAVVRDITDRKMAENALKERESFLANIFASIQDGISILDKDLRIIQVNRKMEEWYEHTMPLVGKKCYKAYHERERACEVCPTQQTLESGETALEVVPKRGPGGSIVGWLDLYSFPLYDSEHKLIGVIEYVRDITERHRAEEALKQSERQHRTLVSNIPGAVYRCELDDDWTMLFLSDRFQDITGYPSADIIANQTRSYESIIHPDDRESVRDGVNRSVKQKKPFTLEYRILHANGEVRWVHENGQAIFDQDGSVLHLDGVILDVTEQRIAEDALRQSEQMYRALFESANDAILIMKDTLFLECNDIALEMFGCNREEILFHSPDEFSPKLQPDGGPSKKSALKRIRAALAGEPQFFEWKHTRCDGAFFDAEVGLNAVQLGDDLVIQAIVRDITDRKRAEKEIKTTAEAASLYLDLMGHDIRNHLQAIVMGTEILTSTGLDVDQSFVINLITESVERSRDLIHKVQETQGLLSAALSKRSLKGALKNSLEVLKETYEDLEIEVDYEIRRAIINADQYLVNLLVNLLENAVIHNNKRPRRVWVTLREAKGGFEISIADNGPGISDEKKENLFDPERRFGGVGIHQALRIAQKYDGHINVDDRVANDSSQGAKFQLWLPKQDTSAS
jgi:PAS domain S-box-containing protein